MSWFGVTGVFLSQEDKTMWAHTRSNNVQFVCLNQSLCVTSTIVFHSKRIIRKLFFLCKNRMWQQDVCPFGKCSRWFPHCWISSWHHCVVSQGDCPHPGERHQRVFASVQGEDLQSHCYWGKEIRQHHEGGGGGCRLLIPVQPNLQLRDRDSRCAVHHRQRR